MPRRNAAVPKLMASLPSELPQLPPNKLRKRDYPIHLLEERRFDFWQLPHDPIVFCKEYEHSVSNTATDGGLNKEALRLLVQLRITTYIPFFGLRARADLSNEICQTQEVRSTPCPGGRANGESTTGREAFETPYADQNVFDQRDLVLPLERFGHQETCAIPSEL